LVFENMCEMGRMA